MPDPSSHLAPLRFVRREQRSALLLVRETSGRCRARTDDLLVVSELLFQLS